MLKQLEGSQGVAQAVADCIKQIDPDREVKVQSAQGLHDCKRMLMLAKAGKYDGYLLEGMGCPGGCVAGAGTLQPIAKASASVKQYMNQAEHKLASESQYSIALDQLD